MAMYFCPLYSGSSGNALFAQYGKTRLLIDAGRTGREIEDALHLIGVVPETVSGLLVTHEHSDHIKSVGVMARRYGIPVYATAATWDAMLPKIGKISPDLKRTVKPEQDFLLGDIGIKPFRIPHDAADPVGYRLFGGNFSISTATDLGYFREDVYRNIRGSSLILLESNHDPEMLKANPRYTAYLKQRILSEHGHLSNTDCSRALLQLVSAGTAHVILGHLSGENNTPELALRVSQQAAEEAGLTVGRDLHLDIAHRDHTGSVYVIGNES